MKYKYIRVEDVRGDFNTEILLFSTMVNHKLFARRLLLSKEEVTSAGFAHIEVNEQGNTYVKCWGESTSLGIKSIPQEDSYLATLAMYENSIVEAESAGVIRDGALAI